MVAGVQYPVPVSLGTGRGAEVPGRSEGVGVYLLVYLALGAVAGTLAGLLGVGGGLVIVPALAWLFHARGLVGEGLMHLAVGTSLGTIVLTSLASVRAHHARGAVRWQVLRPLAWGLVPGALLGAALAGHLSGATLRTVFGVFALLVAGQLAWGRDPPPARDLPGERGLSLAGLLIGVVSSVVGIGGGSMTVPFLVRCNLPMRQAVATSAAAGLPIALAGVLGFLITGWSRALPPGSLGYVYLPALGGIVAASIPFAPLGARLAHALPGGVLRRVFAVFLAVVGARMVVG